MGVEQQGRLQGRACWSGVEGEFGVIVPARLSDVVDGRVPLDEGFPCLILVGHASRNSLFAEEDRLDLLPLEQAYVHHRKPVVAVEAD